ncbi:hypothetical protein [Riemerella columbipharyngis]|uniref:Uncharacterized protein n=1 Tax=Riemerella columbipharyngis TaxID=1071918 RepID=A0A1G6YJM9_9FLAO|nr:hypothetical protein [Riemerella columbipharyngis]SDD89907.1 hypothetical protein SAMN05421544_101169 [Riemerella columbipharyngis]
MEFKGRSRRRSYYPIVFGIVFLATIIKMIVGVASTATDVAPVIVISFVIVISLFMKLLLLRLVFPGCTMPGTAVGMPY